MAITTEATRISASDIPLWSRSKEDTRWIMSGARDPPRQSNGDGGGGTGRRVGERVRRRRKRGAQVAEDDVPRRSQRECLGQVNDARGVSSWPDPCGAHTAGETQAHLGAAGKLHTDIVVLLDGELTGLIEERDDLLGTGPCCGNLVIAEKERQGHHREQANHRADDHELRHAVSVTADPGEPPAGASRADCHDRAISFRWGVRSSEHPTLYLYPYGKTGTTI